MPWYSKRFARGRIELSPHAGLEELKDVFDAFAQRQPGAAMFFRIEQDGSATVYLTPASTEFAAMIQAPKIAGSPPVDAILLLHKATELPVPPSDALTATTNDRAGPRIAP